MWSRINRAGFEITAMPTPLDRLLDAIHPARTHDVVQRHVDETINGFRIVSNIVTDAIEYHDIVCRFTHRLDSRLGLLPADMPVANSVLWERASRLLRESYGPRGEIAAYEIQRVGAEAGLLGVLRRMASLAAEERTEADVDAWVTAFCGRLSADEYLAVGEEYIRKYGHVLPAEMRTNFTCRARLNLEGLLKQHHQLLLETNRVGHGPARKVPRRNTGHVV
jgi:hypothetical protein